MHSKEENTRNELENEYGIYDRSIDGQDHLIKIRTRVRIIHIAESKLDLKYMYHIRKEDTYTNTW